MFILYRSPGNLQTKCVTDGLTLQAYTTGRNGVAVAVHSAPLPKQTQVKHWLYVSQNSVIIIIVEAST